MSAVSSSSAAQTRTSTKNTKPKTVSIGVVLEQLKAEFPDVTVSKIRFLESEGLVSPSRTASGYRRFSESDINRLRYVLTVQRDNYLPLKVIREQLEAMDAGNVTPLAAAGVMVTPENFKAPAPVRITDSDLAEQTGTSPAFIADIVANKLISPDAAGYFGPDDVSVVRQAHAIAEYGYDMRHLRTVAQAARRQADLISAAVRPVAQAHDDVAHARAEELGQQLAALMVSLHGALLKEAVRKELG